MTDTISCEDGCPIRCETPSIAAMFHLSEKHLTSIKSINIPLFRSTFAAMTLFYSNLRQNRFKFSMQDNLSESPKPAVAQN